MTKQAYIGIKFYEDNRNKDLIQTISDWLSQAGYQTHCITRDVEKWGAVHLTPPELMRQTFAIMDESDLIVMEMSVKGVGLGIEAGYAYAKGKYILVLIQEGCELSETMAGIATQLIHYKSENLPDFSLYSPDFVFKLT